MTSTVREQREQVREQNARQQEQEARRRQLRYVELLKDHDTDAEQTEMYDLGLDLFGKTEAEVDADAQAIRDVAAARVAMKSADELSALKDEIPAAEARELEAARKVLHDRIDKMDF